MSKHFASAVSGQVCPVCGSTAIQVLYGPIGSTCNSVISCCHVCSHLFQVRGVVSSTEVSKPKQEISFHGLSCDADYSPVRVGKAQMLSKSAAMILQQGLSKNIRSALDVSAARGDFALWLIDKFSIDKVTCVEPDDYMTESYRGNPRIELLSADFREAEIRQSFDIIYSCHSLEHYRNPEEVLKKISTLLSPEGFLYLEVPNLAGLENSSVCVEEYFYDQHRQHFTKKTLIRLLRRCNLCAVVDGSDDANIRFLCQRYELPSSTQEDFNFNSTVHHLLMRYEKRLQNQRSVLPAISEDIIGQFPQDAKLAVVGAGRLLDAFIKYGNFGKLLQAATDIQFLDTYLSTLTSSIHGFPLRKIENYIGDSPHTVILMANGASTELKIQIQRQFPMSEILSAHELLLERMTTN